MNIEEMISLFQKEIPVELCWQAENKERHSETGSVTLMEVVHLIGDPLPAVKTEEYVRIQLEEAVVDSLRPEARAALYASAGQGAAGEKSLRADLRAIYRYLNACGVVRFDEESGSLALSEKGRKLYEESALKELQEMPDKRRN